MNKGSGRRIYIDFLRIIAIYLVLFNHTGTRGFMLFTIEQGSVLYPFYLFNAIFIKIAVPLFFMASGAVLLGKEESIRNIVTGRFLKYGIVLLAGSIVECCYAGFRLHSWKMTFTYFIELLYSGEIANVYWQFASAYWFLYAYLAYILMLPFIRRLAKSMSNKEYMWMFLMYGAIKSLPIFEFLIWKGNLSHNNHFSFFITIDYVFYPLMGYFIDQRLEERDFSKRNFLIMSFISFIAIVICCIMTQYRCSLLVMWNESNCQMFFNTLIFLPTVTVYYAARFWFLRHDLSSKTKKVITTLSGTTFGLYLIEGICRCETEQVYTCLARHMNSLFACWIWIAVACCLGMTTTYLLKKIPGVRRFI